MRLSTKSRFSVTAMIDIALQGNAGPVSLADIGLRHQISLSYLEQLFSKLRQCGLVESTRGPGGGYCLGRAAETISVANIVAAVESQGDAPGKEESPRSQEKTAGEWMTQELWANLNAKMVEHMQSINLRQLASEQRAKGVTIEARPGKRGVYAAPKLKPVRTTAPNSVFALGGSLLASR
ncbi:transcriptional regulator, BadM/Rrf2 family [Polaromonas sp. OV174]|uniref:Rrf2 family transcriptional regulator n=1 Tax=Polaromonas sp. OV174 TaxID=1855300 RepID=UPI0008DFDD71|nr:Rrf2 family transcriptional regulator [Polaromonas sp. OV174]SFB67088.1 transcriptional regulator, BadM/Rrf2 family [Polaromonas sp. OV174]